jgi:hypothetical protein
MSPVVIFNVIRQEINGNLIIITTPKLMDRDDLKHLPKGRVQEVTEEIVATAPQLTSSSTQAEAHLPHYMITEVHFQLEEVWLTA